LARPVYIIYMYCGTRITVEYCSANWTSTKSHPSAGLLPFQLTDA